MIFSRRGRLEEKKQQKRLLYALVGSVGILVFLGLFGTKLLVGFSLLVDKLRGATPTNPQSAQTLILPPILDAVPVATNSSSLKITGSGQQGLTIIIYVNEKEMKKSVVDTKGLFTASISGLKEGKNTITAKLADQKGSISDLSNVETVIIKNTPPVLEVNSPEDNTTINGDSNIVTITGKTEDETTVTVNGRFVVLKTDNSFNYAYPLQDGDNKLVIESTDTAGNNTKIERNVKYQK
jgi:hypothetical protein